MFIVFDGIDGAGKTTQLDQLQEWLARHDRDCVRCKDPGSTELGEQLRAILLGKHEIPIHVRAEMMMFTTARTQLVEQIIRPALADGKTVLCDRYLLATVVYQGHAGDLDPEELWTVNRIATANVMPDITFILDLPVESAMKRLGNDLDRMESRGAEYFERVRSGFLHEAKRLKQTEQAVEVEVIDAARSPDEIQSDIQARMKQRFKFD